jgi:hypothetical protein
LARAQHDYEGHRVKAMHAVKAALGVLDDHVLKHGTPEMKLMTTRGKAAIEALEKALRIAPKVQEPQQVSDTHLGQAGQQLHQVLRALVANNQNTVIPHVKTAINEVQLALKTRRPQLVAGAAAVVQFHQADTLRKAFLELAGAKHDYDGHRVKAMYAVKAALGPLDEHVLKHGTPEMKLKTKEGQAAVAAAEKADRDTPKIKERQQVSDNLLLRARMRLLEVRPHLGRTKQNNVLPHMDTAVREIHVALKIN